MASSERAGVRCAGWNWAVTLGCSGQRQRQRRGPAHNSAARVDLGWVHGHLDRSYGVCALHDYHARDPDSAWPTRAQDLELGRGVPCNHCEMRPETPAMKMALSSQPMTICSHR